ncbi:MAG: TonB-dependent receptor [Gemmatimonadetes bacterium]|nr:TonB-dependent receptor [Gemmatimonadota bacterium]
MSYSPARAAGGIYRVASFGLLFAFLLSVQESLLSQETPQAEPDSAAAEPVIMQPIAVTATRDPKELFVIAAPISVLDTVALRTIAPNTAADILKGLPGVDVNGVGTNQTRPTIRGQRGQRILLLEDGLRLNNARRQQDFGELPAIVDVNSVSQVEVVRGPASVLYGTDAIGGVVNLRTSNVPSLSGGDMYGGRVTFLYRDEGEQLRPTMELFGRIGKIGFRGSASYRNAKNYFAPSGSFGDITLGSKTEVNDTGVEDQNYSLLLDYSFSEDQNVFLKGEYYKAKDGGFGYVSNDDLGTPNDVSIVIQYPDQTVGKLTAGYRAEDLGWGIADRLDVSGFYMNNERDLVQNIGIPDLFGPGSGVDLNINSNNFTDISSVGTRAEAAKLLGGRHLLTYGLDFYYDDSKNTDRTVSLITGAPFPTEPELDETPNVPNATYNRFGVFAQGDFQIHRKLSLIAGARWQNVRSETRATENLDNPLVVGITNNSQTVVASANVLWEVLPSLNLVGTVGRGFRAPNIIELYFNGPTPEGSGYLIPNTGLESETSLNVDLGVKYSRRNVSFEAFVFRNDVRNGIRITAVPDSVISELDVFQNQNFGELLYRGFEVGGQYAPVLGLELGASFSFLDAEDVLDENSPIADSYRTRLNGDVTYRRPSGRWWASYDFRFQGESTICPDVNDTCKAQVAQPAVGYVLPSFNVHSVRGGFRIAQIGRTSHYLTASLENFTDALYAEFSNATFFRPQPRRTLLIGWTSTF